MSWSVVLQAMILPCCSLAYGHWRTLRSGANCLRAVWQRRTYGMLLVVGSMPPWFPFGMTYFDSTKPLGVAADRRGPPMGRSLGNWRARSAAYWKTWRPTDQGLTWWREAWTRGAPLPESGRRYVSHRLRGPCRSHWSAQPPAATRSSGMLGNGHHNGLPALLPHQRSLCVGKKRTPAPRASSLPPLTA